MISPDFSLLYDPIDGRDPDLAALAPQISVLLPVRNEARHIESTLAQLARQHYDPKRFEILVIDGMSTDGTAELVRAFAARHPNVRLYANPRRLSSAARNIGVRQARGEIIVVVDGHCELPGDRFLCHLAAAFEQSGADCVGRPQPLDVRGANRLQRAIALARSSRLGHHPDSFIYAGHDAFVPAKSVATAYRRRVFDQLGMFDEQFDACEDVEFNHRVDRAGLRCFFTPRVAVRYHPRGTLGGLFRQLTRYGRGRIRLARKHRDTLSLSTLVPPVFVLGLIGGLPLAVAAPIFRGPYAAGLAIYGLTVLAVSLAIAVRRRQWDVLGWLPVVFATVHVASGWGMLWELLAPARRSVASEEPFGGSQNN